MKAILSEVYVFYIDGPLGCRTKRFKMILSKRIINKMFTWMHVGYAH